METQIPNLPTEIINEILLRLPVKSLLRFKSVSKSWRSFISSKDFIKAHLEISSRNASLSFHRIIATSFHPKQISLTSLLFDQSTHAVDFDIPRYHPSRQVAAHVVGCCNGLVCVLIEYNGLILWNPSTKQYKELPTFDRRLPGHSIIMYQLFHEESSDDYKVFGVSPVTQNYSIDMYRHMQRTYEPRLCTAKVYSSKTNSWKTIGDIDTNYPVDPRGKLVSKNLHWVRGNKNESEITWEIISFDLEGESFGTVDLPSLMDDDYDDPSISELKGCLCLLCRYSYTWLDVWLLKQYGVKESWDKMFTITYPCFPYTVDPIPCYGPFSDPICVGDNGEILFVVCEKSFVVYRPNDGSFSQPLLLDLPFVKKADAYVESLVWPCCS